MKITKQEAELRRKALPYGAYIGEDGTETLFNRNYEPIIARDAVGNNLRKAHGWITHTKQVWFYDVAAAARPLFTHSSRQVILNHHDIHKPKNT